LYHPEKAPDILALEWMKKLNSKIVTFDLPIFLPIPRIIVIADPDFALYIIKNNFPKSPTYKSLIPVIGRQSMVITEGKEWALQRKRYNPGYVWPISLGSMHNSCAHFAFCKCSAHHMFLLDFFFDFVMP